MYFPLRTKCIGKLQFFCTKGRKWENERKEENRIYFGREPKQEHMKTTESTEINQVHKAANDLQETINWFTLVSIKAHPEKKLPMQLMDKMKFIDTKN